MIERRIWLYDYQNEKQSESSPDWQPNEHTDAPSAKKIRNKTVSCPTDVFLTKQQQRAISVGGLTSTTVPDSKRRRAHSMPAGSLASRDFFGDSNFSSYSKEGASRLEKLCEHHALKDGCHGHLNGSAHANEQHSLEEPDKTPTPTKHSQDATIMNKETHQKESDANCQCILL